MRLLGMAALLLALVALIAPAAQPVRAADGCGFVLGFAQLHDAIPEVVGACLENEHHNPDNGDALQATANGLMVWRKADNWTAFTNGATTWINGPFGLRERLNAQRFSWEQNPDRLAIVPPPAPGERCHTAALSLSLVGTDAGAGNVVGTFSLTNNTEVSCTIYGYPGARLLDGDGYPLPTNVVWGGRWMSDEPGPSLVSVPGGGSAYFKMHWGQVEVGNETSCPVSGRLAVTPPDEFVPLIIPAQIRACGGGRLDVSAIQAGG